VDAIQKRIKEADDKIKRIDRIVGWKRDRNDDKPRRHGGRNRDLEAELERLADERAKAQAARTKALAELDALKKLGPRAKGAGRRNPETDHRRRPQDQASQRRPGEDPRPSPSPPRTRTRSSRRRKLPQKIDDIFKEGQRRPGEQEGPHRADIQSVGKDGRDQNPVDGESVTSPDGVAAGQSTAAKYRGVFSDCVPIIRRRVSQTRKEGTTCERPMPVSISFRSHGGCRPDRDPRLPQS